MKVLRLVLYPVGLLALLLLLESSVGYAVRPLHGNLRAVVALIAAGLVSTVMILAYRGIVRRFEHRSANELALDRSARSAPAGALLGALLFASVYAVLGSLGVARAPVYHGAQAGTAIACALSLIKPASEPQMR